MRISTKLLGATAVAAMLSTLHSNPATAAEADRGSAVIADATASTSTSTTSIPPKDDKPGYRGQGRIRTAGLTPSPAATLRARLLAAKALQDELNDTPAPRAPAAASTEVPTRLVTLSTGTGQLLRLPRAVSNIFIANDAIADVQMKSASSLYLFAKGAGETSIYATDRSGAVVWSSGVRVGNNIAGVAAMLRAAMPENDVNAVPMNGVLLLQGTVLGPKDAEEAQRLAESYIASSVPVINRLKIATPQQVMLQVKIAEVSRSVARNIGVNILNRNGTVFLGQGTPGSIGTNVSQLDPASGAKYGQTVATFQQLAGTTLGIAGRAFGADFISTLQLYEQDGLVTTLAEPNLVALSGETASFLAGGEIPIPQSEGLGSVSVQFKQYGVSLSFTPTVLSPGRISLHVRPEVSQISDSGSVKINGFTIPALTTRRADTTVEIGSGESFVIGGLLQNNHNNNTNKAPLLGDLPIIGALFRSNAFRKDESELMIVVTPYIVKPISANQVALPTDGYRSATPAQRLLLDKNNDGDGAPRPKPTLAKPETSK